MMKLRTLSAGGLGLVLALAPSVAAQDNAAQKYLESLTALASKSYECDMNMAMNMEAPMAMSMAIKGHMIYGDQKHIRANMEMSMDMEMSEDPMNMTMEMVMDGEMMWMDMNMDMSAMGMGNQRQVMKLPVSSLEQMAQMGGMGGMGGMSPMGFGGGDMDPVTQAKKWLELYENVEITEAGDRVTLAGDINPDKLDEMTGGTPMPVEMSRFRMVIDQKIGFPVEMGMGNAEKEWMTMKMENVKFFDEIPADKFKFVVPEGVAVMDLSAFMPAADAEATDDF